MTPNRYGTLHTPVDIVNAAVARLKDWQGEYVRLINDHYGTSLAPLRAAIPMTDLQRYPENKMPVAVVVVTNSTGAPVKDGNGYYSAPYTMIIGCISAAASEDDARRNVALYGAACRMAVGQRRKLAEDVVVQEWTGESINPLQINEKKRLLVCTNSFSVRLDNVFSWKEGPGPGAVPPAPDGSPLAEWPTITTEPELTITKEPIT